MLRTLRLQAALAEAQRTAASLRVLTKIDPSVGHALAAAEQTVAALRILLPYAEMEAA